jgi:MFS family permease
MSAGTGRQRIYFGWWSVVANAVVSGLVGGFRNQGFSALFKPIALDLGLTRAGVSVASGVSAVLNGVLFAAAGWLSDRFGPKWVIITGTVITAAGMVWLSAVRSALAYNVVWGVIIAGGTTLGFAVAQDKVLTDWFVGRRGLAFGVRFAIMGCVAALVLPVLSWMIVSLGWRMTCAVWGMIIFALIPLEFCLIRSRRPEHYGLLPDGVRIDAASATGDMAARGRAHGARFRETELELGQALKTAAYWLLGVTWMFQVAIWQSVTIHCIPMLTDRGVDTVAAGAMMSLMVVSAIPSRFFGGVIADRCPKERMKFLQAAAYLLTAAALLVAAVSERPPALFGFLILMGFGSGVVVPLDIVIKGRFFGRKAFGAIQGSTVLFSVPVAFFAPVCTGWAYDVTGSYSGIFVVFALVSLASGCAVLFVTPPGGRPVLGPQRIEKAIP